MFLQDLPWTGKAIKPYLTVLSLCQILSAKILMLNPTTISISSLNSLDPDAFKTSDLGYSSSYKAL